MNRSSRSSLKRGFTLTELLVVISIIALLAVLGFSGYTHAMMTAKSTGCLHNLSQISRAALLFAGDHDSQFPQADLPISWDTALLQYLGGQASYLNGTAGPAMAVFRCPADPRPLIITPGGDPQSSFARSYAISGVSGTEGVSGSTWNPTLTNGSRRIVQVASPPNTILFCECFAPGNYQYNAGYAWTPGGIDTSFYPAGQLTHGTRMNFGFVDGHVEALTLSEEENDWQAVR